MLFKMLIYQKIFLFKHINKKKIKRITIAIGTSCNIVCSFNLLLFGIDNQNRIDDFKQTKIKKGDKKAKVSK